jgi:hypothetical protein
MAHTTTIYLGNVKNWIKGFIWSKWKFEYPNEKYGNLGEHEVQGSNHIKVNKKKKRCGESPVHQEKNIVDCKCYTKFFFFLNLGHRVFFICSCIAQTKGFMLDFVCLAFFLFMYIACLATS